MRQDVVVTASPPVAAVARPAPGAVLDAVLERITYANEETGYTIARVATDRSGTDLLTVVGSLLGVQPGESLRLVGRWGSHPKYGRQFEVHSFTTVLPATIQGIERYLGSGLIKGIGPKMAARIVAHFGADTLRVIEDEPARLVEVPGLGPKRTAMIGTAWEEQKAIKEVMVFLQGVGVSTSLAVRIYKKYGDASISVVRNEPYRLAADVWGIGFKTADTIAQAVGIPHDSPQRVKALAWLRTRTGAELATEQEQAVRLALTCKVAVLTGGPGCGKSFTVKSIITLVAAKRAKIVLAAPTGRAAKRLTELSGHPATTVHRLLQLRPGGDPSFDRNHPLDADLVVVDESSMLDLILANKLVKAVPPGAHLLLVGDVDQLPSVGAGEVLRDLLAAEAIPRVRLTQVFRQAAQSGVVTNAHRINAGKPPLTQGLPDFFLFPSDDTEATA